MSWHVMLLVSLLPTVGLADPPTGFDIDPKTKEPLQQIFDEILTRYEGLTHEQLQAEIQPRQYLNQLSYDPTTADHFPQISEALLLNEAELELYRKNGFVCLDHDQRYSFGHMYHTIYGNDLPVFITTDSILHALHRSYDDMLKSLEIELFVPTIDTALGLCHQELARQAEHNQNAELVENFHDIDLYLSVARNLLAGAMSPQSQQELAVQREMRRFEEMLAQRKSKNSADKPTSSNVEAAQPVQKDNLAVSSVFGQDEQVAVVLKLIRDLHMQRPGEPATVLYGGARFIDYSAFRPRGHYTDSPALERYFRAMMWLGRPDCGFNIRRPHPNAMIASDPDRELRDAVLLTGLFKRTESVPPLRAMSDIVDFLVGRSDNLTVFALLDTMRAGGVDTLADTLDSQKMAALSAALRSSNSGEQQIRSQFLGSHPAESYRTPPPALFQVFGQRFIIDAFLLSQLVYDAILVNGVKVQRLMPQGLDVMAALGNDEALPLLAEELRRFQYADNLKASRELIGGCADSFWRENLYNIWLGCLRTLDDDMNASPNFPQAMRTPAWQMKQLQTQLASWSELRHDNILYAKWSMTMGITCDYPAGYVEPYPQFYAGLRFFAEEAGRRIEAADYIVSAARTEPSAVQSGRQPSKAALMARREHIKKRHTEFFAKMAGIMGKLEALSIKELAGDPFTEDEVQWLKQTIVQRKSGMCGPPSYDGWYCDLFYGGSSQVMDFEPTVADVHADPNSGNVLEVGVGDANFCVIAIDNGDDVMSFVGPTYSYYEFTQSADQRLTDDQWQAMINSHTTPPRPNWTDFFQAPRLKREVHHTPRQ